MPIIAVEMTTQEAINFYGGTQQKLADALGISQASVSGWGDYPPNLRQLQLERLSKGKLKSEPGILSVRKKNECPIALKCPNNPLNKRACK
jgi:hypothetical protein